MGARSPSSSGAQTSERTCRAIWSNESRPTPTSCFGPARPSSPWTGTRPFEPCISTGPDGDIALQCAGLFSFIGADPSSGWLNGCAALDDRGFVLTDLSLTSEQLGHDWQALARSPLPFETSHPGLFGVGDLRSGSTKRVAAAVGEGSASVRSVHQYLAF